MSGEIYIDFELILIGISFESCFQMTFFEWITSVQHFEMSKTVLLQSL